MSTSPSVLRGGKACKALASVASLLAKSSSGRCRLTWESDRTKQTAPLPDERLLYLQAKSTSSNRNLMSSLPNEIDCSFELQSKGVLIYPSRTSEDARDLLHDLILQLTRIKSQGQGHLNLWGNVSPEKLVVEYSSPNIAKPLHMGHLRSTVTGNYITQLCKYAGHNVTSLCFLGDWGTQFGVLQAGLARSGEAASLPEIVNTLDIRALLDYYIQASADKEKDETLRSKAKEYSSLLERSDPLSLQIWSTIRQKSLDHLQSAWSQLGVDFDIIQGESEFAMKSDYTERALSVLKKKGYLTVDEDGCISANVPSTVKEETTYRVPLVKSDGGSLYLLRDIAAAIHRSENLRFDRMIYVVDKSQAQHFSNLLHLLTNFGYDPAKAQVQKGVEGRRIVEHLSFGQVIGMSTRAGTFLLLSDAVNDGCKFMEASRKASRTTRREEKSDEETTLQLTVSSLITYFLKRRRQRDFTFNWAEAIKPTGETGMKLQYTHARLKSLEEKQGFSAEVIPNPELFSSRLDIDHILTDSVAMDLVIHLLNFEDSFWASYNEREPCILLTHLFQLCDKTSKALKELPVKTETDPGIAATRLCLFALSRHILSIGMSIAGVQPLDNI